MNDLAHHRKLIKNRSIGTLAHLVLIYGQPDLSFETISYYYYYPQQSWYPISDHLGWMFGWRLGLGTHHSRIWICNIPGGSYFTFRQGAKRTSHFATDTYRSNIHFVRSYIYFRKKRYLNQMQLLLFYPQEVEL